MFVRDWGFKSYAQVTKNRDETSAVQRSAGEWRSAGQLGVHLKVSFQLNQGENSVFYSSLSCINHFALF